MQEEKKNSNSFISINLTNNSNSCILKSNAFIGMKNYKKIILLSK